MRKILKIAGIVLAGVILAGLGFYAWASYAAKRKLSRTYAVHSVDGQHGAATNARAGG